MILVDSSVWIDYFNGVATAQTDALDGLLGVQPLAVGDLMLAEVLQGMNSDRDFIKALEFLSALQVVHLCGEEIAVQSAKNFRRLRALGVTVRSTIDTVIATWCIETRVTLLHSDRDFNPFEKHLGLRVLPRIN